MVDDRLVSVVAGLASDTAEERGQPVVVVLRPLLERVMVAAGALDSNTEEKLCGVFDLLVHLLHLVVPGHRGVVRGVA